MPVKEYRLLNPTDQIIEGCIRGDRHSQNRLYHLYAPKIFPVCLRYSKSREDAEDILQEGFFRIFNHISQYKGAGSFEGWMRKIMVNTALEKFRNKARLYPVISIESAAGHDFSVNDTLQKIEAKELITLIQQLPPVYRMVFNLYVFEGLKHKEIARLLNISEGTSKSNLFDARKILQRSLSANLDAAKKSS